MHPTSHITVEMMKTVLERAFSTDATQSDKETAKNLRNALVGTHGTYQSVIFDIMAIAAPHDRPGLAEMAFLVGMQAGYELGLAYPPI